MEYKVILKSPQDTQKVLNQWKHNYFLTLVCSHWSEERKLVYTLVIRTPKNN